MYRRYLRESPTAPNRAEVEERIAALEQQLGPAFTRRCCTCRRGENLAEPAPRSLNGGSASDGKKPQQKLLPIVLGVVGGAVVVGVAVGWVCISGRVERRPMSSEPVTP